MRALVIGIFLLLVFVEFGPSGPEKNIRFINGEGGVERGAVNLRSEAEPWSGLERKGRGSEHGAG